MITDGSRSSRVQLAVTIRRDQQRLSWSTTDPHANGTTPRSVEGSRRERDSNASDRLLADAHAGAHVVASTRQQSAGRAGDKVVYSWTALANQHPVVPRRPAYALAPTHPLARDWSHAWRVVHPRSRNRRRPERSRLGPVPGKPALDTTKMTCTRHHDGEHLDRLRGGWRGDMPKLANP